MNESHYSGFTTTLPMFFHVFGKVILGLNPTTMTNCSIIIKNKLYIFRNFTRKTVYGVGLLYVDWYLLSGDVRDTSTMCVFSTIWKCDKLDHKKFNPRVRFFIYTIFHHFPIPFPSWKSRKSDEINLTIRRWPI